jgi:hypothetical protein
MKTKIKFSDITGMLEFDEMKEIVGGSAYNNGGGNTFSSGTALGGGAAAYQYSFGYGSNFDGVNYSYYGGGSYNSSGGYNSGYGYTTTDPKEISAIYDLLSVGKVATDCVFQSIAYLASLYGDSSLNINSMQNTYNSLYSGAISAGIIKSASSGVDAYLIPSFSDQFFNRVGGITTIAQLSNFIAAGGNNFALASYSTGNGTGHEFVITGVTSTHYIGWDAQNQIPVYANKNSITGFVAISGICH